MVEETKRKHRGSVIRDRYRHLDMILKKNPNAVITCDEIGCGNRSHR